MLYKLWRLLLSDEVRMIAIASRNKLRFTSLLRRPNHMHSHLDALQAMTPVGLRRGPSDFHSVVKQASFYIAVGAHFQGFWKAKWLPKFDF